MSVYDDNHFAQQIIHALGRDDIFSSRAGFYRFNGKWEQLSTEQLHELVLDKLEKANKKLQRKDRCKITSARVASVVKIIMWKVHKEDLELNQGPKNLIACANGDLVPDGDGWRLQEPVRGNYRIARIPHAYDPAANAPVFERFLDEIFRGDRDFAEKQQLLLAMIGYALVSHCDYERFLIAIGNGANGKSVAFNVARELLGSRNVAAVHPNLLANSHQRAQLYGKYANIITESEQGGSLPAAEVKAIVSGEMMTVDQKYGHPFEMTPFATLFWATNHMPHPSDFSEAIYRRVFIIPFNRSFGPRERDPDLLDKLKGEMPGILNMVLRAYAGVLRDGFVEPASCVEAKKEWRLNADQVAQWMDERTEYLLVDDEQLTSARAYADFTDWAQENGVHRKVTHKSFSQRLGILGVEFRRTKSGMVLGNMTLKKRVV
jgi:putative DNA primase/helicase